MFLNVLQIVISVILIVVILLQVLVLLCVGVQCQLVVAVNTVYGGRRTVWLLSS